MYSSMNRPFPTKNSYSSEDPLYSFYMKYSVTENRWGKILYGKRFIKQEIQVSVFPGAISWINMNELRFIQKCKKRQSEMELSGVSCPKFEILPNSSDYVDMKLTYFNQLTESFLSPKM
jgi:hypothetical protein